MTLAVEPINRHHSKVYPDIYKKPEKEVEVKSIFVDAIENLVLNMDERVQDVLKPSDDSSWIVLKIFKKIKISYKPLLLVHSLCKKEEGNLFDLDDEPTDGMRLLTGVIGAAVAAVGFYMFGRIITDLRLIRNDLDEMHDLNHAIEQIDPAKHPHLSKIHRVAQEGIQLAERHEKRAKLSLALTITAIACAIVTIVGASLANPIVVFAGIAGLSVMGTIELFRLGYEWYCGDDVHTLRRVRPDVNELLNAREPLPFEKA